MTADHGNDLRRAEEHVAEAQRIVHTQKGQLIRLKAAGRDTSDAERRLRLFESNLRRFEEHRNQLRQMNQLTRHPLIKSFLSALRVDLFLDQQAIDTTTPAGKLFQVTGAFAEFERSMIRQRVNANLKRAGEQGKQLGRPRR